MQCVSPDWGQGLGGSYKKAVLSNRGDLNIDLLLDIIIRDNDICVI